MPSPFPGMDPYLEPHWPDIHTALATYTRDHLNERLPLDLVARTEERVAVETDEEAVRRVSPDVRVFEHGPAPEDGAAAAGAPPTAVAEPVLLKAQVEPLTERFVTVIDTNTQKLITVIEFLSPKNKRRGPGMRQYLGKRSQLLDGGVHVVEVDLVRRGDWVRLLLPYVAHPRHHSPYRVTVRRADRSGQVELYPAALRQRLPVFPLPLRAHDPPITLDLQEIIDRAYATGRYDRTIDYGRPCDPALAGEDAAWAEQLLVSAGRRVRTAEG